MPPPDLVFAGCCPESMVHGTPERCSEGRFTGVDGVRFVLTDGVSERWPGSLGFRERRYSLVRISVVRARTKSTPYCVFAVCLRNWSPSRGSGRASHLVRVAGLQLQKRDSISRVSSARSAQARLGERKGRSGRFSCRDYSPRSHKTPAEDRAVQAFRSFAHRARGECGG